MKTGSGRMADLQEELRLIGATDAARVRALATIKATREAAANSWSGGQAQDYIDQQVRIADMELLRQLRTTAFTDSLRYQADLLAAMANNGSIAARGMPDAFGEADRNSDGKGKRGAGRVKCGGRGNIKQKK